MIARFGIIICLLLGLLVANSSSSPVSLSLDQLTASKLVINKRYDNEAENPEEKTGGETVVYNCEYYKSAEDTGGDFKLEWSIDGRPITDKSQRSRVNILETSRSSVRQLKLTIKNVNSETDSGLYECKAIYADSGQPELSRKIRLSVMKPPKWVDESTKVAEKLDTPVTINCEAIGDPIPDVVISLSNGMPLPAWESCDLTAEYSDYSEGDFLPFGVYKGFHLLASHSLQRYVKDGDKVLINELKMEDKGVSIMCTASQILEKFDTPPTVTKFIDIDVYFKPELEGGESIKRYGIIDQNITIPCHSTKSNPLVEKFEFRDAVLGAMNSDDYSVDLAAQKAHLHIRRLEDRHFKADFYCRASNNYFDVEQKIQLEKTDAPAVPSAADLGYDGQNVTWRLEEPEKLPGQNVLPITAYRIKHLHTDVLGVERENLDNPLWATNATITNCDRKSSKDTKCHIQGLRKDTNYAFRFQSVNEAGTSDWSRIYFKNVHQTTSSSTSVQFFNFCSYLSLLFSFCLVFVLVS